MTRFSHCIATCVNKLQSENANLITIVHVQFLHTVSSVEVEIIQSGAAIAGETSFSLSCCVTLLVEEELTVELLSPTTISGTDYSVSRINGTVGESTCTYTFIHQFTPLKTSHGGEYACRVTDNSSIIDSNTTAVNVQSKFYSLISLQLAIH